ncbi:hypothetical protein [uncultured Tenacibaculum sp.]|uniref:hypothetical protein n=1 Tax=uncultured Tenacibaculum sp. TaxID=174713 RepID=UPI002619D003|nr:hypothetical protein [uncultured Tenacibaculum sp.]
MTLTNQQIEQLYTFTRQHFVEHYDVQTELVDHLANDIEQILEDKSTLTFEQARDISFKKFGIFGFMDVVEEKQKQLNKKYYKIILSFVKDWFRLPNLIATITLFFFFYTLLTSNLSSMYFMGIWILYIVYLSIKLYQLKKEVKIRKKKSGKLWLLEDFIFKQGAANTALVPIYIFQLFINIEGIANFEWYVTIPIALISSIIIIVGYISLIVLPQKAEKLLEKHYPEYKLV